MGRRSAWVAWGGLALVACGFWILRMHVAKPDASWSYSWLDLYGYVYPAATFIRAELLAGRLALWNPFQLAGVPTAAMAMPGALYPGNLLLLAALPAAPALAVSTVLHWVIAGGFTWLFARRIGLGAGPATVAALGFMLSGRILSGAYQHFVVTTQVWLPALCWAVDGLVRDGRPRWISALAAVLAVAFLGGYAQTFLYEVQLAACYGAFALVWRCAPGDRQRALGHALGAGLLALGFVAPLLFPALEFAGLATRGLDGIPLLEAARNAVAPGHLVDGLVGVLAGGRPGIQPTRWQVALPALALPLAACAPFARGVRAQASFFALAAILAGLFTLGAATPVFRVYHALPFGNLFRFPVRMDFVYVFCASMLLACGAQGLVEALRRRAGARIAVTVSALLVLAVGAELFARSRLEVPHPVLGPVVESLPAAAVESLRKSGERVFLPLLAKRGTSGRFYAVSDYEPSLPGSYGSYFAPGDPLWHGNLDPVGSPGLVPLLDRMSVRFYEKPPGTRAAALRRAVGGRAALPPFAVERPELTPRTFVARKLRVAGNPTEARHALLTSGLTDAVVERAVPGVASGPGGSARLLSLEPHSVEIEAECAAPCLVVLTDLDYPGWRAELDGAPAEIHRTNLLFRGVASPAGRHQIRFAYRPASFRAGVLAFAASLVGAGSLWGVTYRRARRSRESTVP